VSEKLRRGEDNRFRLPCGGEDLVSTKYLFRHNTALAASSSPGGGVVGQPGLSPLFFGVARGRWGRGEHRGRRHIYGGRLGGAKRSALLRFTGKLGSRFPGGSRYSFTCRRVIVRGAYDGYDED
jgi:hypothetical protein